MKENMIRYLREYGGRSFQEVPFSKVDALVLAQLSYLKLKGIVPEFRDSQRGAVSCVSWEEMQKHPEREQMFADALYGRVHRRIFELVRHSRRYRHVRAACYMEWMDEEQEAQFAAVTFLLGETSIFISFRGTDESLVGWKEDFNMGFMKAVPSQRKALAYLKGVARYTEKGRLILGGHSKGGNLAIYAGAYAPEAIQQRIRRIYSFDGPGFRSGFYEKPGFCRVEKRFCKIVPEQSLVGMLLANYKEYRVVRSYRTGLLQHDMMQWKIRRGKFVYRKKLYRRSRRKSRILNQWMESLNREQIVLFVETLYELLTSTKAKSVYELLRKPLKMFRLVRRSFRRMDSIRKKDFWKIIRALFSTASR